jgi:hypothetical protein
MNIHIKLNIMKRLTYSAKIITTIVFLLFYVNSISATLKFSNYSPGNGNRVVIEGKIIDQTTGKPLTFASVTAVGTNIGTVSNTEGEFYLSIDDELEVKEIIFQHLGYKNKIVSLSSLIGKKNTISMESHSIPLEEVVVRPDDPYELVREVIKRIPQNYSTEPMKHMAFYRESVMKKKKYVSISEAVVEIYKASYNNEFGTDLVKLYKGRKSSNVKPQDTVIVKLKGGPKSALLLDLAKNPDVLFNEDNFENYVFRIDEITKINDKNNYVIDFKQVKDYDYPLFNGKLFVDIKTLAITAAEFSLNIEDEEEASLLFVKKKPLMMKITPIETKYIVKYKEENGKYYFSHARGEVVFKIDWDKKVFNSRYTIMTEIASTDRTDKNVVKFPGEQQLRSTIIFEDKVLPFADPEFWGEYNIIKPEESIENAIKKYGVILKIQDNN